MQPFSNGTHFMDWEYGNCGRCKHAVGPDEWPTCQIEEALTVACCGDGEITEAIWRRMNPQGKEGYYYWVCGEWHPDALRQCKGCGQAFLPSHPKQTSCCLCTAALNPGEEELVHTLYHWSMPLGGA